MEKKNRRRRKKKEEEEEKFDNDSVGEEKVGEGGRERR